MIPTIETIIEDLLAGTITKQQAIGWLHQHAEGAANELRDCFAAAALPACIEMCGTDHREPGVSLADHFASQAYLCADAMLKARQS